MRVKEIVSEVLSRRNFLRGAGAMAATAAIPTAARAYKDYDEQPVRLYPSSFVIEKPDQYVKHMNVLIFEQTVYNGMTLADFIQLKQIKYPEIEKLPPNTIPGINDEIFLTQMGDYNYFVTRTQAVNFAEQYRIGRIADRDRANRKKVIPIAKEPPSMPGNTHHIQQPPEVDDVVDYKRNI
jgi:hypothetical protein